MTTPGIDPHVFPLMPPKSIEHRLSNFDQTAFTADPSTVVYRLVDALCGDAGAGDLKKSSTLDRLTNSIEGIFFSDLDYLFGRTGFLPRTEEETYPYDPKVDMLTSDQWDEVRVKDAWYRARVRDYFIAAGRGGTPEGLRLAVVCSSSVASDIFEVWRYIDNFGIPNSLGRSPVSSRSEVVVTPHKAALGNKEARLLRQMLRRIAPVDSVVTVSLNGLAINTPMQVKTIAADSSYFEVQKEITPTPVLDDLPPIETLAIDLRPSERWLLSGNPETAPYAAFNITQEYGYFYLASGGSRSPIDTVTYGTLQPDGSVKPERDYEQFETIEQYTSWLEYEIADSPDNYPGGKFGITPYSAPAKNPDGTAYQFPYASQQEYVTKTKAEVNAQGGQADDTRYRLPVMARSTTKKKYTPDLAVAWTPPVKDTTVTAPWVSTRSLVKDIFGEGAWGAELGLSLRL